MTSPNFAVYLGGEKPNGFSGFVCENNLFLIIEVEEGLSSDRGREIVKLLKDSLSGETISNLSEFESFIAHKIKAYNLPAGISIASGYLKEQTLYLKTTGEGEIYIHRGKRFAKLISGETSASGYREKDDLFIFTTRHFLQDFGGEDKLQRVFDAKSPHEIVDEITPELKSRDDQGLICLFVKPESVIAASLETDQSYTTSEREPAPVRPSLLEKAKSFLDQRYQSVILLASRSGKRKRLTFVAVIVIFLVLVWSVGLGYKRRSEGKSRERITLTKELITQKLDQAEEVAFLNLSRSMVLLAEAKEELSILKKELGDNNKKEVEELNQLIKTKENIITKKEEKSFDEFFDLTIDAKEAKGTRFYLQGENLSILDNKRGVIYILSLSKKSLDKRSSKEIKNSALVASDQNDTLFFTEKDEVYKADSSNKLKKVIEKDKEWGEIVDMWTFNRNIYLLDKGKDQVYKYLVAEGGYSGKTSYIQSGEGNSLKGATSLAIDSSVYIGFKDHILKYTGGVRDEFKTSFPEETITMTKIFTDENVEKVYGWDKQKGAIYVMEKNGTYERQIKSSILTKATDFIVFKDAAYLLFAEKIYKISLD
ncbi:hypothetical protein HYW87_03480 [Candidatus Roizmanbacteria bacterium]|nr:hypothetical protein [Candidatus Roizmanbacteria bacterium]